MEEKLVSKIKGLSNIDKDSTNEIGLVNTLELMDQNQPCDIYFDILSQKHVDILDSFVLDYENIINRINDGLLDYSMITDSVDRDKFLNNKLSIDILKVPENIIDYDLVVVCSKLTKVLFLKIKKSFAVELKNKRVIRVKKGNGHEYA
ncbi:MAG: hypothetical protein PHT07_07030 [Paludibacter sp.]|nr:hypothetical protein [Paludibacter sp.]